MSSSKSTGRVFLGVDTPGPEQTSLQELEGKRRPVWDESTNQELIDRVKNKATEMAKSIVAEAEQQAEQLRKEATDRGYQEGVEQAREQIEAEQTALAESVGRALTNVANQASRVWESQREDFVALIRLAVRKAVAVEYDERKEEALDKILHESLEAIDSMRQLTIRVNPDEAELVEALVNHVRDRFPALERFTVKPDQQIELGGMVIESDEGMVDNTVDTRLAQIEPLFEHLRSGEAPPFPDETKENG
ncbi:FliH/SctL family protein [Desulfohalovibrio reitneri]|uniref:FliH/SctL family protein n=1 Tax=Desulfohalovibrio reitneri TaxID=1307759 RepID=UPI000553F7BC|nr:FliH/SctL family protein [Desulfohalovibrio reitneri]